MLAFPQRQSFAQHFNRAVVDPNLLLHRLYKQTSDPRYRNAIIVRNNPLIISETNKWLQSHSNHARNVNLDFDMLYPESVLGFIDGLDKYQQSKMKITTYCVMRMHRALNNYVMQARVVRVPKPICELKSKLSKEIWREEQIDDATEFRSAYLNKIDNVESKTIRHGLMVLSHTVAKMDDYEKSDALDSDSLPAANSLLQRSGLSKESILILLEHFGVIKGKKHNPEKVNSILKHLQKWVKINNIQPTTHSKFPV